MELTHEAQSLDLRAYARILWRRKWIFLAPLVVVPVAVYLISASATKVYEASVVLEIQAAPIDTTLLSGQSSGPDIQQVDIAAQLIQTSAVAQAAARQMPPPRPSPGAMLSAISTSVDPNTYFVTITAKASEPQLAANIANAFGSTVGSTRAQQAVGVIDSAIARTTAQLARVPNDLPAVRNQLSARIQRLKVLRDAQGNNAQVIQPASVPSAAISPTPRRDALLGLVIGALLGLGLVAVAESLDRRVRQAEDLERLTGLPLLTSVPKSSFKEGLKGAATIEAFRNLRTNLEFFNVDRDIRTLAVVSGHKEEGKTTVAVNLGQAYALGGADVILVEADLRRPTIAARLDMPAGKGLGSVLVGKAELNEALYEQRGAFGAGGRLRVLPAGHVPPNPGELLRSQRMQQLLEELTSISDLVIIDTSPVLAVSDALPLLDRVSGILVVGRLGVVQRDGLGRLKQLLDAAQSMAVGIVATGAREREPYAYTYSPIAPTESVPAEGTSANGSSVRRPLLGLGRRRE